MDKVEIWLNVEQTLGPSNGFNPYIPSQFELHFKYHTLQSENTIINIRLQSKNRDI